MKLYSLPAFFVLILSFTKPTLSQVIINEVCASNMSIIPLGGSLVAEYDDWIELHNPSENNVNLTGYWLSDDQDDWMKWQFPSVEIPANGYLLIMCSGKANVPQSDYLQTDFKLAQTLGESVVFSSPSGETLDTFTFDDLGPAQADHSVGRNSMGEWRFQATPTPEAENSGEMWEEYASIPIFSEEAGYNMNSIMVSIDATEDVSVYYTLDGSEPDLTSMLYSGPIELDETSVLKALGFSELAGVGRSFTQTATYFFGDDEHDLPVLSISGASLSDGDWQGNEFTDFELFEQGERVILAHGLSDKHGNDSMYDQRGFDFTVKDSRGYEHRMNHQIFANSERASFQKLVLRAASNDNYPFAPGAHMRDAFSHELALLADLDVDAQRHQACVVYINGDYWGVYYLRENLSVRDYYDYYYGLNHEDVDFARTWGGMWDDDGNASEPWFELMEDMEAIDFGESNLDEAEASLNLQSTIDFLVLQTYSSNSKWVSWNNAWWRAEKDGELLVKWRHSLWDLDASWDVGIDFMGIEPAVDVLPCKVLTLGDLGGAGHIPFWNELLNNADFEQALTERYYELICTHLSCSNMLSVLDSMKTNIESEMPRHIERWGGSLEGWEDEVVNMEDFITDRCGLIVDLVNECWNGEPNGFNLTLSVSGDGQVEYEGLIITEANSPQTVFICDESASLIATDGNDAFTTWNILEGTLGIDPSDPTISVTMDEEISLEAVFGSVGISSFDEIEISLFPNPTTSSISVISNTTVNRVQILNMQGQMVYNQLIMESGIWDLNVGFLEAGTYIIRLQSGGFNSERTFVKLPEGGN